MMAQEHPFRASVVGLETMPKQRWGRWKFLDEEAKALTPSQAIRLPLQTDRDRNGAWTRWVRICERKRVIPRGRMFKINDAHYHFYLWYENGNGPRKS